jgi:D-glycero-alpha-D-manno-heptose-7-phosphate kinase
MTLELFQIHAGATLREALERIEQNHHGLVMVRDAKGGIVGLATDGDIRRKLLSGGAIEDLIDVCCTRDFVWADRATPRETLLKQLDQRIRLIPVLDEKRRLVDVVTRNRMPLLEESQVYARARSPVRISFGGGGSDLTHYFVNEDGAVINATISLYSHATLRIRNDTFIRVKSRDLGATLEAEGLTDALRQPGPFGLVQALLKTLHPDFGFDLYLHSDFPMSSGLGGSAVVAAAVLGCFNQLRQDKWSAHELAELAYQSERIYLGIEGGWQDQYATIFGGVNFLEFRMEQNLIHPLRIHSDILLELEESLVLCDTGTTHDSGDIHSDLRQQMQQDRVKELVKSNVALTYRIRDYLLRGCLNDFGNALNLAWQLKKQFSERISNHRLDELYQQALAHGALGGKLLGAGGGGFFLFYATSFRRHELVDYLGTQGLTVRPFRFDQEGLKSWTIREQCLLKNGSVQ